MDTEGRLCFAQGGAFFIHIESTLIPVDTGVCVHHLPYIHVGPQVYMFLDIHRYILLYHSISSYSCVHTNTQVNQGTHTTLHTAMPTHTHTHLHDGVSAHGSEWAVMGDVGGGSTSLLLKVFLIPSGSDTAFPALVSTLDLRPPQMRKSRSHLKPAMNARSTASHLRTDLDAAPVEAIRCHGDHTGWANYGAL